MVPVTSSSLKANTWRRGSNSHSDRRLCHSHLCVTSTIWYFVLLCVTVLSVYCLSAPVPLFCLFGENRYRSFKYSSFATWRYIKLCEQSFVQEEKVYASWFRRTHWQVPKAPEVPTARPCYWASFSSTRLVKSRWLLSVPSKTQPRKYCPQNH